MFPTIPIDFIICGAKKSGTTFLAHSLSRHPLINIVYTDKKKYEFRHIDNYLNDRMIEKHLNSALELMLETVLHEKRNQFMLSSLKKTGIKHPDACLKSEWKKFYDSIFTSYSPIIILRDPIDRLVSNWNMNYNSFGWRLARYDGDLNKCIDHIGVSYEGSNFPFGKLFIKENHWDGFVHSRYAKLYSKPVSSSKESLILSFEEMTSNPQRTVNRVFDFLQIDRFNVDFSKSYLNKGSKEFKVEHLTKRNMTILRDYYMEDFMFASRYIDTSKWKNFQGV